LCWRSRAVRASWTEPGGVSATLLDEGTYLWAAGARLRRGCDVLSQGRVVIADRLHGHILSLLLGLPHVLMNNT